MPARGRQDGTRGPAWYQLYLVAGATSPCPPSPRQGGRVWGSSSPSTRRSRACASATSATASGNCCRAAAGDAAACRSDAGAPALARRYVRDGGLMRFPNIVLPDGPMAYADVGAALEQSMVSWTTPVDSRHRGPDRRQGVHTADDARRRRRRGPPSSCRTTGAAADDVAPTLRVLPGRARRRRADRGPARRRHPPWQRRRQALCLGARGAGRPRLRHGLGAAGHTGVARAIDILRADVTRTLKLLGCATVAGLDQTFVDVPDGWIERAARHAATPAER